MMQEDANHLSLWVLQLFVFFDPKTKKYLFSTLLSAYLIDKAVMNKNIMKKGIEKETFLGGQDQVIKIWYSLINTNCVSLKQGMPLLSIHIIINLINI